MRAKDANSVDAQPAQETYRTRHVRRRRKPQHLFSCPKALFVRGSQHLRTMPPQSPRSRWRSLLFDQITCLALYPAHHGVPRIHGPACCSPPRYLHPFNATSAYELFAVHWDSDIGAAGDVALALWAELVSTGALFFQRFLDLVSYALFVPPSTWEHVARHPIVGLKVDLFGHHCIASCSLKIPPLCVTRHFCWYFCPPVLPNTSLGGTALQ